MKLKIEGTMTWEKLLDWFNETRPDQVFPYVIGMTPEQEKEYRLLLHGDGRDAMTPATVTFHGVKIIS